ncbi:hypothetical protein Q5506_24275 [Escherichia coli]|jgi:hypothetical protein|nr:MULTISPECIES: hypothetical protein [Enterobacteriaceae]EFE0636774.1 hypothetical protein [Escherichia coli]EFK8341640.1 hypothetical protein [Escherichia coli]EHS3454674.1 hypothetical protein [Escherichia coli]EHS3464093.1 hypothetical protein [Escherichia coli]EHS3478405.1 hypothetical protein [Escherichia coli]
MIKIFKIHYVFLFLFFLFGEGIVNTNATSNNDILIDDSYVLKKIKLYRLGSGRNNVVQGVVIDNKRRNLYTLHMSGKPEKGVVNVFFIDEKSNQITAHSFQKPTDFIGHQGLTYDCNSGYLVSSTGEAFTSRGWFVTHFKYNHQAFPHDMKFTKVFDAPYKPHLSTMPTLTLDAKYLIVRSKLKTRELLRVYDTEKVDFRNSIDISSEENLEWFIDEGLTKDGYVLQAITADNKYIYLLSGGKNRESKRLYIYTLTGKLIRKFNNVTIGKQDAIKSGKEKHWEPEGLAIDSKSKSLVIMYALGDYKKRFAQLYYVPLDRLI